jgi:putative phosphoribosyl transferase
MIFKNRRDAGMRLALKLLHYKDRKDVLVLALPRGGVVVGFEIANLLHCPLDMIIIRKIGFPGQPEFAIGAVSETGTVVLNEDIISTHDVTTDYIEREILKQKKEISRRMSVYRSGKSIPQLKEKIIILVDDGVATGATMKAAISTLKKEKISKLVVALPVSSQEAEIEIKKTVDKWVCLETPELFMAISHYYQDFTQISDEEVKALLESRGTT